MSPSGARELGRAFLDAEVVRNYRYRQPYPSETFEILEGLLRETGVARRVHSPDPGVFADRGPSRVRRSGAIAGGLWSLCPPRRANRDAGSVRALRRRLPGDAREHELTVARDARYSRRR